MSWEFDILYAIQGMRTPTLDRIMAALSDLGNLGLFWIAVGAFLLIFRKYRKCGAQSLVAMAITFVIGNLILKNIFRRPRPCQVDTAIDLLVKIPFDYSFPSGHTMNAFTCALTLLIYDKKIGIPAVVLATAIAFSRLYNFMHFPTDVFGGFVIAVCSVILTNYLFNRFSKKKGG